MGQCLTCGQSPAVITLEASEHLSVEENVASAYAHVVQPAYTACTDICKCRKGPRASPLSLVAYTSWVSLISRKSAKPPETCRLWNKELQQRSLVDLRDRKRLSLPEHVFVVTEVARTKVSLLSLPVTPVGRSLENSGGCTEHIKCSFMAVAWFWRASLPVRPGT